MKTKAPTLILTTLAMAGTAGQAQTMSAPQAAPLSPIEQTIQDIKNPVPWLSWGGDFRARNEYFDNLLTLDPRVRLHEQDYFRFRARVWTSLKPVDDLSLNIRLATEPREWMKPAGYTPMKGRVGPDYTEGIIDNLNVQWKNILGQPASIIVGRQDIMLGDGWLMGDGTPFDGSWTYYLDAARFTYELKDKNTTFEAIGIVQDARDNGWLPPISDVNQRRFETEQNEKGAVFQVSNTSIKAANLTGYFIYKHDNAANGINPAFHPDSGDIYTLGGRVTGQLGENWKYSAEGAYQFGQKQDPAIQDDLTAADPTAARDFRDINAFGVNSRLTYSFKDKYNNQVGLAYEFLSGDDPNSKNDEMFDVLWGRWPRWSEIGLYAFAPETRIGQEANMHRIGPTWSITPLKNLDFNAAYYALFSQQDVATRGMTDQNGPLFSGNDSFRGHFLSGVLKYKFSKHMSGHLWSEFLFPGNYYVHKEVMSFLRAELMFTF